MVGSAGSRSVLMCYCLVIKLLRYPNADEKFTFQLLEIKLESSVVENLNIPRMIDKYPLNF